MTREEIIAANLLPRNLTSRGYELRPAGKNFVTSGCPVAQHKKYHRCVTIDTEKNLWHCNDCKRGGSVIDWLAIEKNITAGEAMRLLAGGKDGSSEIVATYDYTDEAGKLLFQCVRYQPKRFKQRQPDGKGGWIWNLEGVRRVLYRLPEVIAAQTVCVAEGEKDADNLSELGFVATTNPMGAGKWCDEYSETLRGKDVVIFGDVGDQNREGDRHTQQVIQSLNGAAKSIKHVTLPNGFHDVSDYIASLPKESAAQTLLELIERSANETQTQPSKDEETFMRLAGYSHAQYDRCRKEEAKRLRLRPTTLDKEVEARRPKIEPNAVGSAVEFPNIEQWEMPVNGADVLTEVADTFSRYLVLPRGAADALALWTAHTHCFEAFIHTPRLNFCSPEKGCGKTTALDVTATISARALRTESITAAVLFRLVEQHKPTLLLDEVDAYLNEAEELRGLLNAGHKRGAKAYRCEGENNKVRGFAAFAPAALAGIGALPGTLHDRSIVIRLIRAKPGEVAARFDERRIQHETELCRKLARWTADNFDGLKHCDPQLPETAFNRLADNWRPLFAIAEVASGKWPTRVAEAFAKLTSTADLDAQGVGTLLLADIADIFVSENTDRLPSAKLAELLAAIEGRQWAEWGKHRKPMSPNQLAIQLRRFGVTPVTIRIGDETPRGYLLADFAEPFSRFLPQSPLSGCNTATMLGKTPVSEVQQPESMLHPENESIQRECCTVAVQRGGRPQIVKPHRPLTERERAILARNGAEHDPIILEALHLFNARIVE
jgi:putative DNA primase/helicase